MSSNPEDVELHGHMGDSATANPTKMSAVSPASSLHEQVHFRSKWICFALTWLSYAGITALRKPLGVGKKPMSQDLHLGLTELGFLDLAFLLPYALVQVTVGSNADRASTRLVLFLVLFVSSLSMISFGAWSRLYMLIFLLGASGAAQALGWPACVKLISGWFPAQGSNNVFGLFGTCTSVGGIGGTMFAVWLLAHKSWRYSFFPQSVFVMVLSFIVLVFLPVSPSTDEARASNSPPAARKGKDSAASTVNTLQLLKIECVKELCLANFLIKLVRYAFFMWLPLYLSQQLHFSDSNAGMMSTTFEIGGFVGTLFSGAIIEKLYGGRLLSSVAGLLLVGCLSIGTFIVTSKFGFVINCVTLFLAGAANVATDPIISAMVPMAVAEQEGTNIKAGLASVINGMGSVGVILEGPIIGVVAEAFGWSVCLYLLVALQIIALFLVRWSATYQRNAALS